MQNIFKIKRQTRILHNNQVINPKKITIANIYASNIKIVNIYVPNTGAPQYIRQTLKDRKGEIYSNTIIVGDFNTPFTPMDR